MPKKKAPARAQPHSKKRTKKKTPARQKKRTVKEGYITGAEFALRVGLSKNATSYMAREDGAPYETDGWRWPEALHWFIRREKARGRPIAGGEDSVNARRRMDDARAEMAELELAKIRGETMRVEQYDHVVSSAFSRVRARLLSLPSKIAGEGEMRSREDLLVLAEQFIHEALAELSTGHDVPMVLEAEVA